MSRAAAGLLTSALVVVLLGTACGTARRSEPLGNAPDLDTPREVRGRLVFMHNCNVCHVGGSGALGPGINDKPLPAWAIRFQVRHGLGVMPAFSERHISEAELDDLVAYLLALRRAGQPSEGNT